MVNRPPWELGNAMPEERHSPVWGSIWRVLFILIAVALIPTLIVQAMIYIQWYRVRAELAEQSNLEFAKTVAIAVHSVIEDIHHDEQVMAASVVFLRPYTNEEMTRTLVGAAGSDRAVRSIHYADSSGVITASSDPKAVGLDLTGRDYWKEIAAGADWAVSDLLTGRATGKPTIFIATAVRGPSKEFEGVILASADPEALGDLVVPGDRPNGGTVLFFDSKGMLLYRRPKLANFSPDAYKDDPHLRAALHGEISSGSLLSPLDGRSLIVARVPIADIGWVAGAGVPEEALKTPITRSFYINVAILLASAVVCFGLAGAIAYAVARGVTRLREHAEAIGRGDLAHRADVGGVSDLRDLAGSVNEMAALLQTRDEALRQRTRELETANRELQSFSYSVSHDLRTPLRAIDGFSQVLVEDYADTLDERGKDYLRRVRSASQRMGVLIDDFLKLSRVTQAEMKVTDVDMSALARKIVSELQVSDRSRVADFDIQDGLVARGDAALLRTTLENLLGNAWKFTRRKPSARIEFGRTEREGRAAYFVRDNGAGFDMAFAGKLFQPFQRLHRTEEFEGTGVGLATVKRIVERHGGEIWAEATVNEGATFYFTLGA